MLVPSGEGLILYQAYGNLYAMTGGALAIASFVLVPTIDVVVAFYGVPLTELADAAKIKLLVQAHFGERDNVVGFLDITNQLYKCVSFATQMIFLLSMKESKVHCQKEVRRQIEDSTATAAAATATTTTVRQRRPDLPCLLFDFYYLILRIKDGSKSLRDETSLPLSALMYVGQVMKLLKTLIMKTLQGKGGSVTKPSSVLREPIVAESPLQMDNVNVPVVSSSDQCVADNVPATDPCTCDISSSGHLRATGNY
nr:carboxymethylenebutenolidase homolog [Tanacetum cinerariifolium]